MKRTERPVGLYPGLALWAGLLLAFESGHTLADTRVVGHIVFARGEVAAQTGEPGINPPRLLGQNSEIHESDVVQTGLDSFAVIEFIDKARMTVRPNTHFSVEKYTREGQGEARITLNQGGIQTTPGSIAGKNPDQVQIQTPVATIKPGNAEVSTRLCGDNECKTASSTEDNTHAARVITLEGMALAIGPQGERELQIGSPVDVSDRIKTLEKSHVVLLFKDSGKITVNPESEFLISEYRYEPNQSDNKSVVKVLSGGIRALTGAIGKENHKNYQVNTPVATIGIRGTGFDLYCLGACVATGTPASTTSKEPAAGLYSYVWKDSITLSNQSGQYELAEHKASYIASSSSPAIAIAQLPAVITQNPTPRPDAIKTPPSAEKSATKGLYVSVKSKEGQAQVQGRNGQSHTVSSGSGGFVGGNGQVHTDLTSDQTLKPDTLPSPNTPLSNLETGYSTWTETPAASGSSQNGSVGCEVQ